VTLYRICIVLHVAAAALWLGHMFFWSLISGPVLKSIQPPATAQRLRELSFWMGGLGWPALVIQAITGAVMLAHRGVTAELIISGDLLRQPYGNVLVTKLVLVALMVVYQAKFGHHPAPRAIYLNIATALLVLGASVLLAG
jgi:uncharacterized membrane protein